MKVVSHSFFLAATINKEASQSTKEHLLCKKEKEIRKHIYISVYSYKKKYKTDKTETTNLVTYKV